MSNRIIFSGHKQKIAEFEAEYLEVAKDGDGLLLTANGEMIFQDTPMLEQVANHQAKCNVTITKDGETVIDQLFEVTFFTLEPDTIAALLQ